MRAKSRSHSASEFQTTPSHSGHASRSGAACAALILLALTNTATFAQTPRSTTNIQLPADLASRVVVARPFVGKGVAPIPTPGAQGNKVIRPRPLNPTEQASLLQTAQGGTAQSTARFVLAKPLAGGGGLVSTPSKDKGSVTKHQPPLTASEKVTVFKYVMSSADNPTGSAPTPTTIGTNLILSPVTPYVSGKGSLLLMNASRVQIYTESYGEARFDEQNGSVTVSFSPPAPGLYVLNFSVDGGSEFDISANGESNYVKQKVQHQADQTIAVPIQVTYPTTSHSVTLSSTSGPWRFYSCEVLVAK